MAATRSTLCGVNTANWIALGSVIATTLSATVAGVSAGVAVLQAKRAKASKASADHAQARAEQHAERATNAAEEAAAWQRQATAAAKRSAEALEKQNQFVEDQAEQAEGVPWEIKHHAGDQYDLWNITNTAKFGGQISGPGVAGGPVAFDRIDGRSSMRFMIAPFGAEFDQVVVTWHRREDLSDERQQWTANKPPKL
jgi:hypothetical protein